ncbi:hypothetical protein C8Q74DRAFT_1208952 [Fomes fomentarius]|nr:hypothetical protein C8Q74DRAFT_1208952 [Fomes fomentarius]
MGGGDSFARVQIPTGFRRYSMALIRRPLVTQCAALFGLSAPGEALVQQVFGEKCVNHDVLARCRQTSHGVGDHATYAGSDTLIAQIVRRRDYLSPPAHDAPPIPGLVRLHAGGVAMLFGSVTLLQGKNANHAKECIQEVYVPTLVRN